MQKEGKKDPNISTLGFPIFSIVQFRGKLIISGGAGARNVGISDKLVSAKWAVFLTQKVVFEDSFPVEKIVFNLDSDKLLECISISERVSLWTNIQFSSILFYCTRLGQHRLISKRQILAACSDEHVNLFRINQQFELRKVHKFQVDTDVENSRIRMALSNSGKYLAAGCADKHLRVYLLYDSDSSDDIIPEMIFEEKLDDQVNHVAFSSEDEFIVICTEQSAYLFCRKLKKILNTFKIGKDQQGVATRCTHGFFSLDQRYLHTVHSTRRGCSHLAVWDLVTMTGPTVHKINDASVTCINLDKTQKRLGMCNNDGFSSIANLETFKPMYKKKLHTMPPQSCVFSEDQRYLYSVSVDYRIGRLCPENQLIKLGYFGGVILILLISFLLKFFFKRQ